jgi:hypothetical protein
MPSVKKSKKSAAQKALQWFLDNPGAKVGSVAKRFKISVPYAYKLRAEAAGEAQVNVIPGEPVMVLDSSSYDDLSAGYTKNLAKAGAQGAQKTIDLVLDPRSYAPDPGVGPAPVTADGAFLDSRAPDYGAFVNLARLAQALKREMADHAREMGQEFTDDQWEALEMIATKMARIVNGNPNKSDSWDDIAGYATLVSHRIQGRAR